MAAPYGLLFPGFMGQRFALPMQDDLSRLPPDRGLIGGDMPGQGPLPGPYELASMRRPTPARGQQPAPRLVSERRPAPQRQNAPAPDAMPQMMPATPQASPQGAPAGPLGGLFQPENRDVLGALGVGLMRGDFSGGIADALKIKQGRAQENQTRAWLMKRGLSPEDAALAASNPTVMQYLLKPGATDEFKKRAEAAISYGMKPGTPEFQRFVLTGDMPTDPNARDQFGNSPIWGKDKDGNWVVMQPSSGGGIVQAPTPEGITLVPPGLGNVDLGPNVVFRDRSGAIVGGVNKDLGKAEADKAAGKAQGDAIATYRSMTSKMPGLETVVKQLDDLAGSATYTLGGQALDYGMRQLGMDPRQGAVDRTKYTAIVSNQILPLLRDTFGAQFTAREGDTLMATLGDPDKSPPEKQAALKAFIEQKRRDIEALAQQSGQSQPTMGGPVAEPKTEADFNSLPSGAIYRDPDDGQLYQKP